MRQATVESRQSFTSVSCELSEVGICYLSMTDHATDLYIGERDAVGPKLVAVRILDCAHHISRSCCGLARAHQESNQASLRDRARRKSRVECRQPFCGRVVMHVLGNDQRDEHVRVKQRRHSSSSNERTSSEVTTLPTLIRGNPVLGSLDIAAVLVAPRPRRMRSATVSLNVRWVSRAIASACLCRSLGGSMVVRTPKFNYAESSSIDAGATPVTSL